MSKVIRMTLDPESIRAAIKELRDYEQWVKRKANELAERLAQYGLQRVQLGYDAAQTLYEGDADVSVTVEKRGENTYAIVASGATVLILEFGAGIRYGEGHPQAADFGYGPGTYPGQTHVPEPGYWWFTDASGESHYSVGNAPSMVMYLTAQELEWEVERVAKEVFSS